MTEPQHDKFNGTPYSERQLIAIVPAEVIEAEQKDNEASTTNSIKDASGVALNFLLRFLKRPEAMIVETGIELYKAAQVLRRKGINVYTVTPKEASHIVFPPGHPRKNLVYVGHPASPNIYYPITEFHRLMFESKFAEAVKLLMGLGAKDLNISRMEGWGYEMSSQISLPLPQAQMDANMTVIKNTENSLLFTAWLQPEHEPIIPDNLMWLQHEPTWQMVADGRLKYGLKQFSINVSYKDDFGVNMSLKSKIEKAGIDFGAGFQDHKATVWNITGAFH